MRIPKLALLIPALLFISSLTIAQTQPSDPDPEKEKKAKEQNERIMQLLDQAVDDAVSLRLPQNRAVVYAMSGDLYWKFDEKRARELFRNAATELVTYNLEVDKERRENPNPNAFADPYDFRSNIRNEILPLVAKHDAEFALELLVQTRPTSLAEAMARAAMPNRPANDMMNMNPDRMRVAQEIALEQQFALLAADANPDKAIKMIKDSLSKGISANVIPLLQKLHKKDEKKAMELAGDVIKKLVDTDLSKGAEEFQAAMNVLQFAFRPPPATGTKDKQFSFSETQVKDLANKVATTLLNGPKTLVMTDSMTRALPMLEKFVPEKVALLRHRKAENEASMPPEFKQMLDQQKLFDPNSTAEDILAQLPKMQEYEKAIAYTALSGKIAEVEDEVRAKKLIEQIPDEKTKANLQEQFESARIARTASAGKLDEARKLIGNLTNKRTQIQRLVGLAMDFQRKGGEKDIATAKVLMKDAKALTVEFAETMEEIGDTMEVVRGYVAVDPDIAFRMFEPVVDKINEHVQASATLARFNPQSSTFKKSELVLSIGSRRGDSPLFQYIPQMQMLGKADLERMYTLCDRFARSDSRTIAKLFVLQGFLLEDKKPNVTTFPGGPTIIFNE